MKAPRTKVDTLTSAMSLAKKARAAGKRIVTTNGCFDILHTGHVRYLTFARSKGDVLIVGINTDASVRASKGPTRPVNPARERAEVIAALSCVDAVFLFSDRTPEKWIKKIRPHIHVKGGDYTADQIIEKNVVEESGGKIVIAPHIKGRSTSTMIEKIRTSHSSHDTQ